MRKGIAAAGLALVGLGGCSARTVASPTPIRARAERALSAVASAPRGGLVEVEATVRAGEDEPPSRARARALAKARRRANERAVGARVQSRLFHHLREQGGERRQIVDRFTSLAREGLIVGEEILAQEILPARDGAGYSYRVRLRARVARPPPGPPGCELTLEMSRQTFVPGDSVEISVTPTRDAYLYLFSVSADGRVTWIFPSASSGPLFAPAGRRQVVPGARLREQGVRLEARLQEGSTESVEALHVIGLRDPALVPKESPTLPAIFRRLLALDREAWCEGSASYSIHRR
jgi:hypothetical protein